MTAYDVVEYPPRAFSHTHPERLATMAVLLGLNPPPVANCRVLDVGCGSGWNLIPMAHQMPSAAFFGFDLAAKPIAAAQADAAALGLRNVRFQALDLMEFPATAGHFDYIIAHGFYSWVPQPVRLALLEVCRKHLSPSGVAFISYNANPYGHLRRMWRGMMQHHLSGGADPDPAAQLQSAGALLAALASQFSRKSKLKAHGKLLEGQLKAIRDGGGNWFFHDDLGPVFEPMSIAQFGAELAAHGLAYAGDALFENMRPQDHLPQAIKPADWLDSEQYADYFCGRGFRNSLVTHAGAACVHPPPADAFERLLYAAPLRLARTGGVTTFRNEWTRAEAEVTDEPLAAAIQCILHAWPDNVPYADLCRAAGGAGIPPEQLFELIVNEVIAPSVTPRSLPRIAGDKPEVWAPARLQVVRGRVVTNRLHGAVQLEQEELRQLVVAMDGTQTRQALGIGVQDLEWLRRAALLAS